MFGRERYSNSEFMPASLVGCGALPRDGREIHVFNDENQNVTNQLQGEVYESAVLDQLDLAVRCVLDARATTICSLNLVH